MSTLDADIQKQRPWTPDVLVLVSVRVASNILRGENADLRNSRHLGLGITLTPYRTVRHIRAVDTH